MFKRKMLINGVIHSLNKQCYVNHYGKMTWLKLFRKRSEANVVEKGQQQVIKCVI